MAIEPVEYEGWSSKMGVQVVPRFSVFQTFDDARGHVPHAPVRGIDGHVGDAPGHEGRADAAQFEGGEEVLVDGGGWGLGLERGENGEDDGQGQCGGGGWGEEGGVRRTHNWHS